LLRVDVEVDFFLLLNFLLFTPAKTFLPTTLLNERFFGHTGAGAPSSPSLSVSHARSRPEPDCETRKFMVSSSSL
jgi:hypothetical protein